VKVEDLQVRKFLAIFSFFFSGNLSFS